MITSRIMHLVKADLLSPSINSGLAGLTSAISNKLNEASKATKAGIKREMSKNYQAIHLEAEKPNIMVTDAALQAAKAQTTLAKDGALPAKSQTLMGKSYEQLIHDAKIIYQAEAKHLEQQQRAEEWKKKQQIAAKTRPLKIAAIDYTLLAMHNNAKEQAGLNQNTINIYLFIN